MLEIGVGEEIFQRGLHALRGINLSLAQPLLQVFGGEVDVDDLIGLGQHRIGNSLAHFHADELFDGVVEAFEMLNVEGGDDVNAGGEDVLNILVSLGVFAAGDVGVGQFIDDGHLRVAVDDGIDIHFLDDDLVIFDFSPGDDFQPFDQFGGFGSAVGFDEADDDVDFLSLEAVGLLEHAVSFTDAGAVSQINLQPAPLGPADHLQKCLCAVIRHSTTDGQRRMPRLPQPRRKATRLAGNRRRNP